MLKDCAVVAFVGVADLVRARAFYEGLLGLDIVSADDFAIEAKASGTTLRITKVPAVTPAAYTIAGFAINGIDDTVDGLAARGVMFERYAFLGAAQNAKGIWTSPSGAKVAWFKDPDGNLLSISKS